MLLSYRGRFLDLSQPVVMGILNATPDSFFSGSRVRQISDSLYRVEQMLSAGASLLDIGGASTRPGAEEVSAEEELRRVIPLLEAIAKNFPDAFLSVDTYRTQVAKEAVEVGVSLVNDISAGQFDPEMFQTIGRLQVPYILMHNGNERSTMHQSVDYQDITIQVFDFFIQKIAMLRRLGVKDVVLDLGFGFAKSGVQNFQLLKNMHVLKVLDCPLLAGISRKSMIWKTLKISPNQALNGTTALHWVALQQGAKILRAHDVAEAKEVITLWQQMEQV